MRVHSPYRSLATIVFALLVQITVFARDGYEVMGYFTSTRFDTSNNPAFKSAMMFNVKVLDGKWRIRTEPVINGQGGIGFHEVFHDEDDSIISLTMLGSAYDGAESPFRDLRENLNKLMADDPLFTNSSQKQIVASPLVASTGKAGQLTPLVKPIGNVATARVIKSDFPPVDPTSVALIWFGFTPPRLQTFGTNEMLLQIWDDGSAPKSRFRQARWNSFPEAPHLVSNASFNWTGKQILANGAIEDIKISDVTNPLETAASYEVASTTNLNGMVIPLNFKLTRFKAKTSTVNKFQVANIVNLSVVRISQFSSPEELNVQIPGKTFFSDYRLSSGELQGRPLNYIDTNPPPEVSAVKDSKLYKRTLMVVNQTAHATPRSNIRWILAGCLLIPLFALLIYWKRLAIFSRSDR